MGDILALLKQGNVQIIVAVWCLAVGFGVFIYIAVEQYRRQRKLKSFGVSQSDEKINNEQIVEFGKYITNLFAASQVDIAEKFSAAGIYDTKYAHFLMPAKYFVVFTGTAVIGFIGFKAEYSLSNLISILAVWLVAVIILPDAYLSGRTKKLRKKVSNQLPYLLDLMGVCVQTGMTIEAAMSYLAQEMVGFDRDLAYMLKRTNDRAQIVGLEQSLEELYNRVPTTEVRSFVMTLNQSLQYGSSIYTVLTTLAVDIREVQMLGLEEQIGKLSAKMSIPLILFIMIPIVILITAPGVMRMMG